ncbi:MAG: hypothetical protein K8S21_11175 [Gemmatimonadetes bacterium]|nr:hypothetical protein [Gemmatimonadota bacterium]
MASTDAKVKKLEKKIASLEKKLAAATKAGKDNKAAIAELKKCCKKVEKWIELEVAWSNDVTKMLRAVKWSALVAAYPGGPGTNPPITNPDWPPAGA